MSKLDPETMQKVLAMLGVNVEVGAELTAEQKATVRLRISERREERAARREECLKRSIEERDAEYKKRHGQ